MLNGLDFSLHEGRITTLIGANGCGKSTLFNLMTKNLKPDQGEVFLREENIANLRLKDFAREAAIVHQYNTAPPDLTVEKACELRANSLSYHGAFIGSAKR